MLNHSLQKKGFYRDFEGFKVKIVDRKEYEEKPVIKMLTYEEAKARMEEKEKLAFSRIPKGFIEREREISGRYLQETFRAAEAYLNELYSRWDIPVNKDLKTEGEIPGLNSRFVASRLEAHMKKIGFYEETMKYAAETEDSMKRFNALKTGNPRYLY